LKIPQVIRSIHCCHPIWLPLKCNHILLSKDQFADSFCF